MPSSDGPPADRQPREPAPPEALAAAERGPAGSGTATDGRKAEAEADRESSTDPGATFVLVLSAGAALVAAAGACLAAIAAGVRAAGPLYVLGGYGWLLATATLAAALSRYGVPRALTPAALYPFRAPALAVLPVPAFACGYLAVAAATDPTPRSATLAAGLGAAATLPGVVLWFLSRNAVARALRARASHEWTGPRSPRRVRRRRLVGVGLAALLAAGSVASLLRGGPNFVGLFAVVLVLAANAGEELRVAVTPGGLVVGAGSGDYYRVVRWATVTGVARRGGALVVERRGPRPSLSFDASAVPAPDEVVVAVRERAGQGDGSVRPR